MKVILIQSTTEIYYCYVNMLGGDFVKQLRVYACYWWLVYYEMIGMSHRWQPYHG
jgi:hypothetical protein